MGKGATSVGGAPEAGSAHTVPWRPRVKFQGLQDMAAGGQLCLALRVTPELGQQVGLPCVEDGKQKRASWGCEEWGQWGNPEDHVSALSLLWLWLPGCPHVPRAAPPGLTSQAGSAPSVCSSGCVVLP